MQASILSSSLKNDYQDSPGGGSVMSILDILGRTSIIDRCILVKHSKDFITPDSISTVLKLFTIRATAILATTGIWVSITLLTGFFTVGLVVLLGMAVGSSHFLLQHKPQRYHLLSALLMTVFGGVICNVFAGLALFSSKMGVGYWQVLSANLSPENLQTLGGVFVRSARPEDLAYYLLATTAVLFFAQHSYFHDLNRAKRIEVQLKNGRAYRVGSSALDVLLSKGRVIQFRRSDGWAIVGLDPLRDNSAGGSFFSPERRS